MPTVHQKHAASARWVALTDADYMREASRIVLNGFELRTDVSIVRYPEHYRSEKGAAFWGTVSKVLDGLT
jgi:hypothetical protein